MKSCELATVIFCIACSIAQDKTLEEIGIINKDVIKYKQKLT